MSLLLNKYDSDKYKDLKVIIKKKEKLLMLNMGGLDKYNDDYISFGFNADID